MKTLILINPAAGGGKAKERWPALSKQCAFLKGCEEIYTQRAGEATTIVREFLKKGFGRVLVVGGDGTLAEAANGFFENEVPLNPNALLGTIPLGSGSDFLKTLGVFSVEEEIQSLEKNRTLLCDVGHVTYLNKKGKSESRLFLNISSFGCSGEIVDRVNRSSKTFGKSLGATATYLGSTLFTFLTYQNPKVDLEIDGKEKRSVVINNLFVCNGKYSGSGMLWGPKASITDGLFDLTVVKDLPKLQGLLNMRKIYQGKVLEVDGVERISCHTLKATSEAKVQLEVDGDTVGSLPVTYRMFSHRLMLWY